ncbi:MAG: RIP metalloprotease RseP [Pseudoflavonifractor sp.]|nr:RIP metalloprotease RseP [Alloprevotella sp.]MCM1116807.1 RIP metalloprotease RseP [Pseudoflavonifractor sp.]
METIMIKALQLIAALSLLVLVHELGHYVFARVFKIKVERFFLFFNPWISLLQYDPAKGTLRFLTHDTEKEDKDSGKVTETKAQVATLRVGRDLTTTGEKIPAWRQTIYGIGWLPLGGYCKIAGMIDETTSKDDLATEAQEWEFRSRPAYQRLLVMVGGVMFNFIAAVIIYIGMAWHWGEQYVAFEDATEGYDFVPAAIEAGFRNGDIPYAADGKKLDAGDSDWMLRMAEAKKVTVIRNHCDTVDIAIPEGFIFKLNDDKGFLALRMPVVVANAVAGQAAAHAGIIKGDRIIAVGDSLTPSYTELTPALAAYANQPVEVKVEREGKQIAVTATPSEGGKLGIQLAPPTEVFKTVSKEYGLLGSIPHGVELGTTTMGNYVASLKHLFSREGAQSIGGFGAIGSMFPDQWNWYSFWNITAFISLALAFMNIIPIPALDGGHVMFLLWEMVTGRQPSMKFLEMAQYTGMALLFALLLYANGMDIIRAFFM